MMGNTYVLVPNGVIDSQYIVSVHVSQQGVLIIHTIDHREYQITDHVDGLLFLDSQAPLFLPQELIDYLKVHFKENSKGLQDFRKG